MFGDTFKEKINQAVSVCSKFEVFKSFNRFKLEGLVYCFKEKNLRKGSYIYREGVSETDGVYFVVKGQLERIKEDPYEDKKEKPKEIPKPPTDPKEKDEKSPQKKEETQNPKHAIRNIIPAFVGRDYGVSLTLIEDNEVIGLDEIIQKKKYRQTSVKVVSDTAFILFMSIEDFRDKVLNPQPYMSKKEAVKIKQK